MPVFYKGYIQHKKIQPEQKTTKYEEREILGGSLRDRLSRISFKKNPMIPNKTKPISNILKPTDAKKSVNPKLQKFIHLKI